MTENTETKVTGKKILEDCAILAKDLGAFVMDIGKRAYAAIKVAMADKAEKNEKKSADARAVIGDEPNVSVAEKPAAAAG